MREVSLQGAPPAGPQVRGVVTALVLGLAAPTSAGCLSGSGGMMETGKPQTPVNVAAFQPRLTQIAQSYEPLGRVDDELRWAPFLCRQPQPSQARISLSGDGDTHGQKLYYIFAGDREAYLGRGGKSPSFVGQVVVKEAWSAREVPADTPYDTTVSPVRYLKQDGRLFHAEGRSGLFIMYKLDPKTPDTDLGWVYGTVAPDGTVTSAGRVESCMGCHQSAPNERLFGMKYQGA